MADEEQVKKNKFMSYFTKEDIASPSKSGSDSDVSNRAKGVNKKARAGTGGSKAATYSRSKRESFRKGTLKIDDNALENWKKQILIDDQHAEFDPSNVTRIRHYERVQAKQEECQDSLIVCHGMGAKSWRR